MKESLRSNFMGLVLAGLMLMSSCFGCATTQTTTESPTLREPSVSTPPPPAPARNEYSPFVVPFYPPPASIDLCGEPVPLHIQEVAERFDKEFTLVVYNHAQVYLWLKRMERYFPWIEERLRHYRLPDDLKYVAIVESDLLPNACSPKGAAGPWQFMPKTGSSYGMETQGSYDERFDFERATDGAFRYLADLNKRYKNWALAIACYNCGDKRIIEQSKAQRTNDYYHLKLPVETERYVFRILAIKAVLGNPSQYGYNLPKGQGYGELKADRVTITLSKATPIQTLATAAGTTYREMKRLNPTFRSEDIPAGTYEIKLPRGTGKDFKKNFDGAKIRPVSEEPAVPEERAKTVDFTPEPARAASTSVEASSVDPSPAKAAEKKPEAAKRQPEPPASYHTVKKGDTLSTVAQQYKVSVQDLKKLNQLKGDNLTLGQKLRIR